MIDGNFQAAWPSFFDIIAEIKWSEPVSHQHLFTAGIPDNETAYFYSIIAQNTGVWMPYYIGMTTKQSVALRNQQRDHRERFAELKESHPNLQFMLTLGTPKFERGRATEETIRIMEGLLIYCNWHDEMANTMKVQTYSSVKHVFIRNTGWSHHIEPEVGFGVFYKGHA